MNAKKCGLAASLLAGCLWTAGPCAASSSLNLTGELAGSIRDVAGVPQMGATVLLFNRYDRLVQKTLSGASGDFLFAALAPDLYSIRITLSSFVPAVKTNIAIQAGMKSLLAINLATILSSIELISTGPSSGTLMSDDWKWVLRSTMTTRPVLRYLPGIESSDPTRSNPAFTTAMFSDTRGVVKLSSGESNPFSMDGNQPDLGTTFALATSLYGKNNLQFSGNIGYALNSASPAAGFRTSFSRSDSITPVVKLTMQQLSLPVHGLSMVGAQENLPALRTLSLTVIDRLEITDDIDLEYGASLDSLSFVDRLNYISPFARLNYRVGGNGTVAMAYSSGMPPVELIGSAREKDENGSLQQDMSALTFFPRISVRNGTAAVQRTQTDRKSVV